MFITKEMEKDFDEHCLWNPRITNLVGALEDVSDALAMAGYRLDIIKETKK